MQPPIINIFEKAAKKAGRILSRDYGEIENLQTESKSLEEFVEKANLKVNENLLDTLKYFYPSDNFITDINHYADYEDAILIEKIDCSMNFNHSLPFFSIVISKICNNEITDGIIYNPVLSEFYWASKGKGAWCNNKRLRVSDRRELDKCLISYNESYSKKILEIINNNSATSFKFKNTRYLGSTSLSLAYVASGKLDVFLGNNLNIINISSGILLILEAGGKITELDGKNWEMNSKDIVASNLSIHSKIGEELSLL